MARNADPHPTPDDPNADPVPHIPGGSPEPRDIGLARPDRLKVDVPGVPPARQPFPDHTPDPGVTHE